MIRQTRYFMRMEQKKENIFMYAQSTLIHFMYAQSNLVLFTNNYSRWVD